MIRILFASLSLLWVTMCSGYAETLSNNDLRIQGNLESLVINGEGLIAEGWVGSTRANSKVVSISIFFGNELVYKGPFERQFRPDVIKATGRSDWTRAGWRIDSDLPSAINSGSYPVRAVVRLDNGHEEILPVAKGLESILVTNQSGNSSFEIMKVRLVLIFLSIFLAVAYFKADYMASRLSGLVNYSVGPHLFFELCLLISFMACVALGISGSSLNLASERTPFVSSDVIKVWGGAREIRSDEWGIYTPLAIAQYNHRPQFPIVNDNLGQDGQNMLVLGMVGIPVAHFTTLAKPATWGFFLFDLKRALSWYWLFPIFACLIALARVISIVSQSKWNFSFLLALSFLLSPYVAAWSNWPAYSVFFPSLAFIVSHWILNSSNKIYLLVLGLILGVSLAGFVLVLYPPWNVSLGYVFLVLFAAYVHQNKLYKNINSARLASFSLAIIMTVITILKWWLDSDVAIRAMLATAYPGQRDVVVGGSMYIPELLRGFTNLETLYKLLTPYANESEIASFYYMFLPLLVLFLLRLYRIEIGWIEISLFAVMIFVLYFMLVGLPFMVAKISLWGRVIPQRADLALGLIHILLCGLLLGSTNPPLPDNEKSKIFAFAVSVAWGLIIFGYLSQLHSSILSSVSMGVVFGILVVVVVAGYWLVLGRAREFIYIYLGLSAATVLPFNPVVLAPNNIIDISPLVRGIDNDASQRVLVLEKTLSANQLLASGRAVENGTFYYPQISLWRQLDKDRVDSNAYNRYQHLNFTGGLV